ncbi:MAG TPA: hypothetical protein VN903_18340, partial [Polyangia bacterium]|nr:hypothetical protein [Polyangia bacterium]
MATVTDQDGTSVLTDSYSNDWILIRQEGAENPGGDITSVCLYYCADPIVGAGHTFSGAGTMPSVSVLVFSGLEHAVVDRQNGGNLPLGAPVSSGSITPSRHGALVVTSTSDIMPIGSKGVSPPFGPPVHILNYVGFSYPGVAYTIGSAYYIQPTRAAISAEWNTSTVFVSAAAAIIAAFVPSGGGPVEYEDPCTITEPRLFATVKTGDETLKFGVQPLRDTAALGGYAEPRLLDLSPMTRAASDPATGAWSAQTASMTWADTDRVNRERSQARTSFRNCDAEIYLTSSAQRQGGGPPRVLFAGTVYEDSVDANLVLATTINDLIGSNYSLFSEEKQIPQRVIEKNWFPNAPDDSLGQAEPIVGGRRRVLNPAFWAGIEGVSTGVYVGQVQINGSHGTPDGTTLADIVAALNASGATGTIYVDWGFKIGYGDAVTLQGYYDGHGTVPTDYDGLAQIIGYSDLDAWLAEEAHTGGDLYEAVVVAGHAIAHILPAANTEPSIWVGDTQVALADIGVSVWAPQIPSDTSWGSDIGFDLFTDILGADGTTRRYTLVLFDPASTHGLAVAGGAVVHVDCDGLEDTGDGTGDPLTDYFDLYRHVLINFVLQDYQSGAWLTSPQFLFSDGVTLLDRVDTASFAAASTVAGLTVTGGYQGSFTLGERASVRNIIANFNLSGGCLLAQDDYGRLFVRVLDTRRTQFLTNRITGEVPTVLRDKVDFLPGFAIQSQPDWQVNKLTYQYAHNGYRGAYERDAGGGGNTVFVEDLPSQTRDGVLKKTVEFAYLADDLTADAVARYYLQLFKDLPRVANYTRRGLCGLEDDLLDGRSVTHYNGYGANGWQAHAIWIIGKTFDPKRMVCTFT